MDIEISIKEMMDDPNIPAKYKMGGRLSSEFLDGVDYAEQKIQERLSWRSVKDELPEANEKVLVRTNNGKITTAQMDEMMSGRLRWRGSNGFQDCITHWRPLFLTLPVDPDEELDIHDGFIAGATYTYPIKKQ